MNSPGRAGGSRTIGIGAAVALAAVTVLAPVPLATATQSALERQATAALAACNCGATVTYDGLVARVSAPNADDLPAAVNAVSGVFGTARIEADVATPTSVDATASGASSTATPTVNSNQAPGPTGAQPSTSPSGLPSSATPSVTSPTPKPTSSPSTKKTPSVPWPTLVIRFQGGTHTLSNGSVKSLKPLVKYLKAHPNARIVISGHTDSGLTDAARQKLSQRRADVVAAALRKQGIAAKRMTAIGKSDRQNVAPNKTAAGRAANRRVEFSLKD